MQIRLFLLVICCWLQSSATVLFAQPLEEFNGPFPSWANVKLRFGAKGNGKDDDTKAIQTALDSLGVPNAKGLRYTVLYFPRGNYCISTTIVMRGKIGVAIIGEDPATTAFKWIGDDGYPMFWANGSAYYKISRFTWNPNNHKDLEGIGIHWKDRWNDGITQSYASLNIEISDHIFLPGFKYGIAGGTNPGEGTGANDSEIAIKRCLFQNCTGAGIYTTGYNALDYWIWDCRFLNCFNGIDSRYGNYNAYRSYFSNSAQADVINTNGYYKSLRGCYSQDSRAFQLDLGFSTNPFKRIYQANTVIRPKSIPIQYYHWGRLSFFDNVFDKPVDTGTTYFIKTSSDVYSLNNKYVTKQPVNFTAAVSLKKMNDEYLSRLSVTNTAFINSMSKTPLKKQRRVFEVPPGANDVVIQSLINDAAKLSGQRPVIHFAAGTYLLQKPLTVPANADMQFIGDGALDATVLMPAPSFPAGNAMLRIAGPSSVCIAEMQFGKFTNTNSHIDAIHFLNADQPNGVAFLDQLYIGAQNTIRGEQLDYLYIQKDNSFFADNDFLSGGPLVQKGGGTAVIAGFGGQFAGVNLQGNAKAVYKDCWWEGDAKLPLNLTGSGRLTIDGSMIAPNKLDSATTMAVNKFDGTISLLNTYIQGGITIKPENPGLKMLIMNVHTTFKLAALDFITPAATYQGVFTGVTSQCFGTKDPRCEQIYKLQDRVTGAVNADNFTAQMITDDRKTLPLRYEIKSRAATAVFLTRVSLGDMNYAIKFSK